MPGTIQIVDGDQAAAALLRDGLRAHGFVVDTITSSGECLERLKTSPVDLVVTDAGLDLCTTLREQHPDVLSIVLTSTGDLDTAIAAIRSGAYDFMTKPIEVDALAIAVRRALAHQSLEREVKRLRVSDRDLAVVGIAGSSPAIRETLELIARVAESEASVLVTGESGTGKELVARALHSLSTRREQPFVAVNCAAMPVALLESELFGHVRGAFTDAKRDRPGLFVQAAGGTLFLDEVGEMPLEMQVKLLRVLQERVVRPVGGDEEVAIDVRVVTATNRDLETEVEEKRFREDLFYRINVVAIPVPPLRARGGDVLVLAHHFLKRIAERAHKPVNGIAEPAARLLVNYDWPGNVRELENCIERAVALCRADEITVDDLPTKVQEHRTNRLVITAEIPAELITMAEMERRYARQVLDAVGGNKTQAARILGIDRRSLYRRLDDDTPSSDEPT